MDEAVIIDLKQFITATISQQTSDLRQDISRLDQKIDNLSAAVAVAIDTSNATTEARFKEHDRWLTVLESKTA